MTGTRERRGGRRVVVLLAALAATGLAHRHMDTAARIDAGEMFVPPARHARLTALGFDAALSDFYWLQAVQLVGGSLAPSETAPTVGRLIDLVTTLDPWVGHPYRFAAVWLTDSVESVVAANRLLRRAIAYHPDDWRNHHYLGFNHFYYLGQNDEAERHLERAVSLPDAPAYLASLVAKLRTDRDGLDTAAAFLLQLARGAGDEYMRAQYLKALDEVETERRARALDRAREIHRQRFGRDIERVSDLVSGPAPVLRRLPAPHPHLEGFEWKIQKDTGRIVSSFYRHRYEPHVVRYQRERRERWKREFERLKDEP